MLKTNPIKPADINLHLKTLRCRFDLGMQNWPKPYGVEFPAFTYAIMEVLVKHIDSILTGDAKKIWIVIDEIDAVAPAFNEYLKKRPSAKSKKRSLEIENLIIKIESLFNYKKFIEKKGDWNAYTLVGCHGLRICPYCQLHHVNYHNSETKDALDLRPPLDHFLPKSRYPYLAVSLQNLVPSCHQCNSSIKRDTDPGRLMPHPFDTAESVNISFQVQTSAVMPQQLKLEDLTLQVKGSGNWDQYEKFFRLNERYQWYVHEVFDMLERRSQLTEYDAVMRSLLNNTSYVLGFQRSDAHRRALGLCLLAIADYK